MPIIITFQHERQIEKEKSVQLTQKLDEEWKNLRFLMSAGKVI